MKHYSEKKIQNILHSTKYPNHQTNINKRMNQIGNFDFESRLRHYRPMSIMDTGFLANLGGLPIGGWKELGRTTLGVAGDTIDVTSLADKRYLMTLTSLLPSGTLAEGYRLNSDTGTNYASRRSANGGADSAIGSQTYMDLLNETNHTDPNFGVQYLANYSTKEKLTMGWLVSQSTAGAGTAPNRKEIAGKHAQTTNPISAVNVFNAGAGDFASGSEVVVLGWSPTDVHTTNFWEQLASVQLGASGDNLSSGTITAKKYLWVQAYLKSVTDVTGINVTFNNDVGNNYAQRQSYNGGADSTNVSRANFQPFAATLQDGKFVNMFIINNSANEKLVIVNGTQVNVAGATSANQRIEQVAKWTNTANQITEIDFDNAAAGSYDVGSILKIWGSN